MIFNEILFLNITHILCYEKWDFQWEAIFGSVMKRRIKIPERSNEWILKGINVKHFPYVEIIRMLRIFIPTRKSLSWRKNIRNFRCE